MPKLSKIRLTGCKYDGLRKEHENSIFDLTRGERPDHTLFTLKNNGGKGVMMQLIFQLLLPETKWGKNNGNQVISMFYDIREKLHPFTFHVVLEWVLDTIPEKRLITGIGMKSVIKNTSAEDEENTGLSYILYTYEHNNNGYYTVETLPLYDNKKREAVDLTVLEEFLNHNKRDFIKYSQSSGRRKDSDYFRYLESRGIYRNEWLTLKSINRSEGGISDYFSSASDNKGVFDKVIIPAISENIRNYSGEDENSLIEMFKSNLSITKDLPILLKRESDYRELMFSIEPLILNSDSGARFVDQRDRLIDEGNDIFYILNDEKMVLNGEIEKWSLSNKRAVDEKEELYFKKDNINYNRIRKELLSKEDEAKAYEESLEEKETGLVEKQGELTLFNINKILYGKRKVEKDIENKNIEKETMLNNLNLQDIRKRAEELDDELELEWEKTKSLWTKEEINFKGYINYTEDLMEQEKIKRNKYLSRKETLQNEINQFKILEENLERKRKRLEEDYDMMSLGFPERILEDLNSKNTTLLDKREKTLKELDGFQEKANNLKAEINRLDFIVGEKNKERDALKSLIEKQEVQELELARTVSQLLFRTYDGRVLDNNWFEKSIEELENLSKLKLKDQENIQNAIWEKNIQRTLNKEEYYIPNRDILVLKEEIQRLGIHVETGIAYLQGLDNVEKGKILGENPGFIYSLVISSEREWDLILKNLKEDIFLSNMVPIFIPREVGKTPNQNFRVIAGRSKKLVEKNNFHMWKNSLEEEFSRILKTKENIGIDLEEIGKAKEELKLFINKKIVYNLNLELKRVESLIVDEEEKERVFREDLGNILNKLELGKSNLLEIEASLAKLEKDIKLVKDYMDELRNVEERQTLINKVNEELKTINIDISYIDDFVEEIRYSQSELKQKHFEWKFDNNKTIERLKNFIKEAQLNFNIDKSYKTSNMPSFNTKGRELVFLLEEREAIEKDIISKNTELALIDNDIKHLNQELQRCLEELEEVDENWKEFNELIIPPLEIDIRIMELKKNIEEMGREKERISSKLYTLKGEIKATKRNLNMVENQIFKDHGRVAMIIDFENIDEEAYNVDLDIKSNKDFLELCVEELDKNKRDLNRLEINLNKISHKPELDFTKGKMSKALKDRIATNIDVVVDTWQQRLVNNQLEIDKTIDEGERNRTKFIKEIELKLGEDRLKEKVLSTIREVNIGNFRNNRESFNSMKEHFSLELMKLTKDKEKAEEAMKQWTNRASIYVIRMIETLKDMLSSMNYINDNGYVFPLVKIKGIERLPKEKDEIEYLLKEYFVESIAKILQKNENIENIDDRFIENLVGDNMIFSKALQGRYPVLLVYKMTENNEFKFAKARDEHYATWEAINKGEGISTEGSGGQTLSVTTFVTMMIMSFKKKHIGNENPSTILLLDNPFGKASGKHVLDPIFEIADKLNFQLISFAAPEIIKVEISERFPVFWELRIEDGKIVHGGRVIK